MPDESTGIAYLMALKRGTSAAPAAARENVIEPKPDAASKPTNSHQGAEKRRSPRYKCEGSAQLNELHTDVRTWATFTDISLHGCYLEAQATYPVGTVLGLKLEAKGHRIEASGNVRVSYPYLGMGIAFIEMTPENQSRLKDLLLSLSSGSPVVGSGNTSNSAPGARPESPSQVSDSGAAVQALLRFFADHQWMTREDFLQVLRKSQSGK